MTDGNDLHALRRLVHERGVALEAYDGEYILEQIGA